MRAADWLVRAAAPRHPCRGGGRTRRRAAPAARPPARPLEAGRSGGGRGAVPRHLRDTSATPPRHLRDTPPRHASETHPRHLRDTFETPSRHLLRRTGAPHCLLPVGASAPSSGDTSRTHAHDTPRRVRRRRRSRLRRPLREVSEPPPTSPPRHCPRRRSSQRARATSRCCSSRCGCLRPPRCRARRGAIPLARACSTPRLPTPRRTPRCHGRSVASGEAAPISPGGRAATRTSATTSASSRPAGGEKKC